MTMIPRQHFSPAPRVNVFLHCSNTQDFSLFISHTLSSKIWNTTYHASNASFLSTSVTIKTVSEAIAVSCNETKPLHCCICDVEESWETPFCCENWLWRQAISWALFARVKIYSPGHEAVFLSPCKQAGGILSHSISVTRRKRQISDVNILTFKLWI